MNRLVCSLTALAVATGEVAGLVAAFVAALCTGAGAFSSAAGLQAARSPTTAKNAARISKFPLALGIAPWLTKA